MEIHLLDEPLVRVAGEPVAVSAAKQRALLAILALERGRVLGPDRLVDDLWGASPPATAAKNLQVLIGKLRAMLEPGRDAGSAPAVLVSDRGGYRLDAAACHVDVDEFEALVREGRGALEAGRLEVAAATLRRATALVRGAPLEEFAYQAWASPHVARLGEACIEAEEQRIAAELELGRHEGLVAELETLVARHPRRERLREYLMLALYRCGRQSDALEAYAAAREMLDSELGLEPSRRLRDLQRRVLEQDPSLDAVSVGAGRAVPRPPNPRTSILGRERELEALDLLVGSDAGARLVTICGWGGVGKTRAAAELARRVDGRFDAVAWIELAPVSDASLVASVVESAFGIGGVEGDPVYAVAQFIGSRSILLVLDNFEHVIEARDVVARLLAACERLVIVVTSRTALGIYGEHEFALDPLPVPSDAELERSESAMDSASLRLFASRARASGSPLRLDHTTAPVIARICQRVDGLPLGIELAAARARLLAPAEILERLDRRLALLTSGPGDHPDRQRSLRAAIEWSYELLDPDEQAVFHTLGVFAGGCTVEAALAVATTPDDEDDIVILDRLESLVSKRLLARDVDALGAVRLTMLESIAEFARTLLHDDARRDELHRRHAEEMRSIARRGDTHAAGEDNERARRRVMIELANLRAAADWAIQHDPELAGSIVGSLGHFFLNHGSRGEARELVLRALEVADATSVPTRARLTLFAGRIEHYAGHPDEAASLLTEAIDLYRADSDPAGQARAMNALGEGLWMAEHFEEARTIFDDALELATGAGSRWDVAWSIANLGNVAIDLEEPAVARAHFSQGRELFDAEGDTYWSTSMSLNLGIVDLLDGAADRGLDQLNDALVACREFGHTSLEAHVRCNQVRLLLELERWEDAAVVARDAIPLARQSGDVLILCYGTAMEALALTELRVFERAEARARESAELAIASRRFRFIAYVAFVLARAAFERGDLVAAAHWHAVIDVDDLGATYRLDRHVADVHDRQVAELRSELGADRVDAILGAGQDLPIADRLRVATASGSGALDLRTAPQVSLDGSEAVRLQGAGRDRPA